jgi:hypothetical protein
MLFGKFLGKALGPELQKLKLSEMANNQRLNLSISLFEHS